MNFESKGNPAIFQSINSGKGHKENQSKILSHNSSDTNFKPKNNSVTNKGDENSDDSIVKVVKMDEDTEGGWEVAGGGRKKSKTKLKQIHSNNNAQSYQNGINANTKSQIKESYGGQKGSQRKASTPTSANTLASKKTMADKKDKNKNTLTKHDQNASSAISKSVRHNTNQKDNSVFASPVTESTNCPTARDATEIPIEMKIAEEQSSTIVSNGDVSSNVLSNEPEVKPLNSISAMSSDSNGNILVNSLNKNSVITDVPRDEKLRLKNVVDQTATVSLISSTPGALKDLSSSENYNDTYSQTLSATKTTAHPKYGSNVILAPSAYLADVHATLDERENDRNTSFESNEISSTIPFQHNFESKATHCLSSNEICSFSNDDETNTQNEVRGIQTIVLVVFTLILGSNNSIIDKKYIIMRDLIFNFMSSN